MTAHGFLNCSEGNICSHYGNPIPYLLQVNHNTRNIMTERGKEYS